MKRIAIVGSTASGKSAVALAVAREISGVELVSIDAMQVYRGMDIGTAKPTTAERAAVPHHLIDLIDPSEEFAVAEFQRAAAIVDADLRDRSITAAVAVGGTGLYLTAVIDGLDLPGQWPDVRRRLEAEAEVDLPAMFARLVQLDPPAAGKIDSGNARRIVRALEVCEGGGRPFSSYGPGVSSHPPTEVELFGLRWARPQLRQRIARRVEQMMVSGLLDEVTGLAGGQLSRTARQALGYKELLGYLDGIWSLDEATAAIIQRTQQFAVRQERWFRRDPRIRWIDVDDDPVAAAVPLVLESFHR